jgi:hypothetical protein
MSRTINNESWGPNHQQLEPAPPQQRSPFWKAIGWFLLAMFVHGIIDPNGTDLLGWSAKMVFFGWVATKLYQGVRDGRIPIDWLIRLADQVLDRLGNRFERTDGDRPRAYETGSKLEMLNHQIAKTRAPDAGRS